MADRFQILAQSGDIQALRKAADAGDIPAQTAFKQEQALRRMVMTPAERKADIKREQEQKRLAAAGEARIRTYKSFDPASSPLTTVAENFRAMTVANDFQGLFRNFFLPQVRGVNINKFRFIVRNGKRVFVPFDRAAAKAYLRNPANGRWIPRKPFTYKCPADWFDFWEDELTRRGEAAAKQYPSTDPRHAMELTAGGLICEPKRETVLEQLKTPALVAAGVVAAGFLGPAVLGKVGSVAGGKAATAAGGKIAIGTGGKAAAGAVSTVAKSAAAGAVKASTAAAAAAGSAAKASLFSQAKAGANNLLGYVNKARTVEAIAKGELPPPPISIAGNSFKEWAYLVAKDEIQKEAIQRGTEYAQRKMTEREERKLREEIDAIQRELMALDAQNVPPAPPRELAAPVKAMQSQEEKKAKELQELLLPALLIGGAYLLSGA